MPMRINPKVDTINTPLNPWGGSFRGISCLGFRVPFRAPLRDMGGCQNYGPLM